MFRPHKMRIFVIGDFSSIHVRMRTEPLVARDIHVEALSERANEDVDFVVHAPSAKNSNIFNFRNLLAHYSVLRSCQADIFHVHYAASVGAWLYLIARRKEPLIVSVMGGDVLDKEQIPLPRLARWMTTQVIKHANRVTYKTDRLKQELISRGVSSDKTHLIVWGIDLSIFKKVDAEELRGELNIKADAKVVFSPRSMKPFYNLDILIESIPNLLNKYPKVVFVLSMSDADQNYKEILNKLAVNLGVIEQVRWVEHIDIENMSCYYSLADVVVSIPNSDGLPQSVLESLACGTPCVIAQLENYSDVFKGNEGVVLSQVNAEEVANAIESILGGPERSQTLIQSSNRFGCNYTDAKNEIDRVETMYASLIKDGSRYSISLRIRLACAIILILASIREFFCRDTKISIQQNKPDEFGKFT